MRRKNKRYFNKNKLEKVWKKASEEQKKKIFYYSLFDFKSFEEEGTRMEILNKIKEIQNNLTSLIKEIDKNFFSKMKKNKFFDYAANDRLLKTILLYELKNKGIRVKSCGNDFPDLMINDSTHLEIKRQLTTKNMGEDFWGVDKKDCNNLLLLVMFPLLDDDKKERVKDLTSGFYYIKDKLADKRHTEVLICYPDKENFREIVNQITRCIKSPNWKNKKEKFNKNI